jgi:hypothetical protein
LNPGSIFAGVPSSANAEVTAQVTKNAMETIIVFIISKTTGLVLNPFELIISAAGFKHDFTNL